MHGVGGHGTDWLGESTEPLSLPHKHTQPSASLTTATDEILPSPTHLHDTSTFLQLFISRLEFAHILLARGKYLGQVERLQKYSHRPFSLANRFLFSALLCVKPASTLNCVNSFFEND